MAGTSFASLASVVPFLLFILLFSVEAAAGPGAPERRGGEPTIGQVQEAAVRHLGFDPHEIDSWRRRARWAAALPRLQVGFDRDLKQTVNLTTKDNVSISGGEVTVGPDENNFDQDFNRGTSFGVKAVWYLDELVFTRDSLLVSSERRDWIRERDRVVAEVTEAYFDRRRYLKEGNRPLADRATARLDASTGGWFSRELSP